MMRFLYAFLVSDRTDLPSHICAHMIKVLHSKSTTNLLSYPYLIMNQKLLPTILFVVLLDLTSTSLYAILTPYHSRIFEVTSNETSNIIIIILHRIFFSFLFRISFFNCRWSFSFTSRPRCSLGFHNIQMLANNGYS